MLFWRFLDYLFGTRKSRRGRGLQRETRTRQSIRGGEDLVVSR